MVSQAFVYHWVMQYDIPELVLNYIVPQCVDKFFAELYGF